ncbi:MAG: NAD(P)/FAD-dependent oxidoreductase [Planctomycetes bacterium]|nr:NAD(P)/FAD-dependent oxidoreductase [Planctomycetota bacterium]
MVNPKDADCSASAADLGGAQSSSGATVKDAGARGSCDVLIVGGGPAGSSCAWALAGSGLDVCLLDKAEFPRDKVCAGWITPAVAIELELDLAAYQVGRTLQPFTGFRTGLIGGAQVLTRYDQVVSYGIRRCEFDEYLLRRCGARLFLHESCTSLRREGTGWIVNERFLAKCVVGAGGHFCPVARLLGCDEQPTGPVVLAQETEFEMSADELAACQIQPDVPELFFCSDLQGYAWCVRKGNFLNIGIGREGESHLASHMSVFCDHLRRSGKIDVTTAYRVKGHAYRLYRGQHRQVAADAVLLIGDSAGLAYPQSGEGIRPAIESGLMAAATIRAAGGDYRQENLADYSRRLKLRFGKSSSDRNAPPGAWRQVLGRRLLTNRWFTRHVVIDRWFLHRQQRPLVRSTS